MSEEMRSITPRAQRVLALLQQTEGRAAQVLRASGVDREKLRREILLSLRGTSED